MTDINTNKIDRFVSAAKGIIGVCPIAGPMASEAIGSLIPNQRLDRVVQFLKELELYVGQIDYRLKNLESNIKTSEGLDIFEEGLNQSTRAVSDDRKKRLARFIGHSLTQEKIKYAESRKLLNLFRELTDPEILWLVYYSTNPTTGSEFHKKMINDNPEILMPVSREMGAPQEQIDKGALQDSYKNTLSRLGLTKEDGRTYQITYLGDLLVRYIESNKEGIKS